MPLAPLKKEDAPNADLEDAWGYYQRRAQYPSAARSWDCRIGERDHGALLPIAGGTRNALQYDIGNPLTPQR
jgi:hypothetical protein